MVRNLCKLLRMIDFVCMLTCLKLAKIVIVAFYCEISVDWLAALIGYMVCFLKLIRLISFARSILAL